MGIRWSILALVTPWECPEGPRLQLYSGEVTAVLQGLPYPLTQAPWGISTSETQLCDPGNAT